MNTAIYNTTPPTIDWLMVMPTLVVLATGVLAFMVMMLQKKKDNMFILVSGLAGLAVAAFAVKQNFGQGDGSTFAEMVMRDNVSLMLQLTLIVIAFVTLLFSESYLRQKHIAFREFYPLVLWATAGGMIMVSTRNMLMMFIGLEVLSISLYILAGMSRYEAKSEESAIKYFLLGAFASAFLLYGMAMVYGATGSVHLDAINAVLGTGKPFAANLVTFGLMFILIALSFKCAFVPFHQWTPDVYQGAPTNVTAFMAAASKVAAVAAVYRIFDAAPSHLKWLIPAFSVIAILTMTIPNLMALVQKDVKRVLGYSSISNAGYVLVAVLASHRASAGSMVLFLVNYSVMTLGVFAVISLCAKQGKEGTSFDDLKGLAKRSPFAGAALIIFVASLIGVPPTGGFFGKLAIFQDALTADMVPLAIALAINSAISVYYYLRIVLAAFVQDEEEGVEQLPANGMVKTAVGLCALGVISLMFLVSPIANLYTRS